MTVSDGVSPSPSEGAEPARPPSKSGINIDTKSNKKEEQVYSRQSCTILLD